MADCAPLADRVSAVRDSAYISTAARSEDSEHVEVAKSQMVDFFFRAMSDLFPACVAFRHNLNTCYRGVGVPILYLVDRVHPEGFPRAQIWQGFKRFRNILQESTMFCEIVKVLQRFKRFRNI